MPCRVRPSRRVARAPAGSPPCRHGNAATRCCWLAPCSNSDQARRCGQRSLEVDAAVWPAGVVVLDIPGEHTLRVWPDPDQRPVQTLGAHRADPAFGVRVRPRRPRRYLNRRDAGGGEHRIERRVSSRGALVIAGQRIQAGIAHSGRTLSVEAADHTIRVYEDDGTVPGVTRPMTPEDRWSSPSGRALGSPRRLRLLLQRCGDSNGFGDRVEDR